ncbi:MAG: thioesterase domain-containing protein, partial [Lutisporaceae bacterium]
FIQLDKLPITPNGKVDKKALPEPERGLNRVNEYTAPENSIEKRLSLIWSNLLGLERISTKESFFEVGGHSLKATTLAVMVHEEFGKNLPLKEIFNNPTIKEMAEYIIDKEATAVDKIKDDNLILLRKGMREEKNLFLIHAGNGEIEAYVELCNLLNEDYNCWAIRADRFSNYGPQNIRLEELAEYYLDKIRSCQSKGAYSIIGWCVGGTIAYEMVRQLEASGGEIEYFAMINSSAPQKGYRDINGEFSYETERSLISERLPSTEADLDKILDMDKLWEYAVEYIEKSEYKEALIRSMKAAMPINIATVIPGFEHTDINNLIYYFNLIRTFISTRGLYLPDGKIKTQVEYFEAIRMPAKNKDLWNLYCEKPMTCYKVDGDHYSIFKIPEVVKLAEMLNERLR